MIFIKHTHLLLQIFKNACTHLYPISDVWEHFDPTKTLLTFTLTGGL